MTITEFWSCRPVDSHLFLKARLEAKREDIEQAWDYTRHGMYASIAPHSTKEIKPTQLIRLKRDGKDIALTRYDEQELTKWNEAMDKEINGEI